MRFVVAALLLIGSTAAAQRSAPTQGLNPTAEHTRRMAESAEQRHLRLREDAARADNEGVRLAAGWFLGGSTPHLYEVTKSLARDPACGDNVLRAKRYSSGHGFGTVMQMFKADTFRGKRVRLSAFLKGGKLEGWAGLWMRVDGAERKVLAFDNMQSRPLTGSTGCERHEVVLDVPNEAERIVYGVIINGPGAVFVKDLQVDVVEPSQVPTTDMLGSERSPQVLDKPNVVLTR